MASSSSSCSVPVLYTREMIAAIEGENRVLSYANAELRESLDRVNSARKVYAWQVNQLCISLSDCQEELSQCKKQLFLAKEDVFRCRFCSFSVEEKKCMETEILSLEKSLLGRIAELSVHEKRLDAASPKWE
jgi:hypothetical protein